MKDVALRLQIPDASTGLGPAMVFTHVEPPDKIHANMIMARQPDGTDLPRDAQQTICTIMREAIDKMERGIGVTSGWPQTEAKSGRRSLKRARRGRDRRGKRR